jgi:SNF2 family DNA or RNA helicase
MSNYIDQYLSRMSNSLVRARAQSIIARKGIELLRLDVEKAKATFRVQGDVGGATYRATIHDYTKPTVIGQCNCNFDGGGLCVHEMASLLYLQTEVFKESYNPKNELIDSEPINLKFLQQNSELQAYTEGVQLANMPNTVNLKNYNPERIAYKVKQYSVEIELKNKQYQTTCDCDQKFSKLCSHKIAAFIHLGRSFGKNPFNSIKELDTQKVLRLKEYGYAVDDEKVDALFDIEITNGVLAVKPKIAGLSKLNDAQDWKRLRQQFLTPPKPLTPTYRADTLDDDDDKTIFVYVFKFDDTYQGDKIRYSTSSPFDLEEFKTNLVDFKLGVVQGKWKKGKLSGKLQDVNISYKTFSLSDLELLDREDAELMQSIKNLQPEVLTKRILEKHIELRGAWSLYANNLTTPEQWATQRQLVGEILADVFRFLPNKQVYKNIDTEKSDSIKHNYLLPLHLLRGRASAEFSLDETPQFYVLSAKIRLNDDESLEDFNPIRRQADWIYESSKGMILLNESALRALDFFTESHAVYIKKSELSGFLADFVLPLMNFHNVELNVPIDLTEGEAVLEPKIYLTETEDTLTLNPVFAYNFDGNIKEFEINNRLKQMVFEQEDNEMALVYRNDERENIVRNFIQKLHPKFEIQALDNPSSFTLGINELFENEWFFTAFEKLKTEGVEVLGFAQLKKLKYNPNRAKINIKASSGIDWFDLEVLITFGEQSVNLKDVRKAIFNKQHYIRLGDGTLGILPQEWIEKYASVLKMGDVKGDKLRLSQFHISLVDELYGEIDGNEVLFKLMEKRNRLRNFESIEALPLPQNSTAVLRGYQQSGYNWMNFLDEFGWGGILADDMGLGKTVQAITFLQKQVETKTKPNLVIVPKSLVFNWQKECEKFAPELDIMVYYGTQRKALLKEIPKKSLTITTYGAIRSDIGDLRNIDFNYIILDESQSIKNPDALVSKAVKLLNSDNRLTLTGTPIENNVFDLYSQMDFLNPGMLGNIEFFKREFANPIDREKDPQATHQLRKLVYPFILRRTKEEVAKELPEKSESVIYCEMDKHQRRVYDGFKDKYRDMVLGKIDSEGIGNAGMYILEGLMKLRQICDSPALLNDKEDYGHESVKLAELIPRIQEDSGRHKILVFSQFLGMLDLMKKELDKLHIPYEYLDGQTTDRQVRVENFQTNDSVRVFLMSLKAGGVGLNLTAADYVYIVDPWWNPAVEAQAIDRTHRIGQEKPVFAYKMICKDTVEEKILLLQEKKKSLAKDLIHVESGFVKALTRDDVISLFS